MNKNDKYLEQNIEKLVQRYGGQRKMDESKKEQIIEKLKQQAGADKITPSSPVYKFRRFAFAAAAVLVIGALLIGVWFSSEAEQEIEIPPELAAMSAEQLIELYYDSTQMTYAPEIVRTALEQALEKIDPRNVIEIAQNVAGQSQGGLGGRGSRIAPPSHPLPESSRRIAFPEVVEESNLMVHARLVDVDINVDYIVSALLNKAQDEAIRYYIDKYWITIQLEILDVLPEGALETGQIINVPAVISEEELNALQEAEEYFIAMVQDDENQPRFFGGFTGIYSVDYDNPVTPEFWQFFEDAYDILLFSSEPSQETIDYWTARLESEDKSSQLALEYIDILPDELIPAGSIFDAIENRYVDLIAQVQQNYSDAVARGEADIQIYADGDAGNLSRINLPFFFYGIKLLLRADDKDIINGMLALFDGDIDFGNKSILWRLIESTYITNYQNINWESFLSLIVRLNLAAQDGNPGEKLIEIYKKYKDKPVVTIFGDSNPSLALMSQTRYAQSLLEEILNQAGALDDADIILMALEMLDNPSEFGFPSRYDSEDAQMLGRIWGILAPNKNYNIRSTLEDFLSSANLSEIGIYPPSDESSSDYSPFYFEQAAFEALLLLDASNRPSPEELLNWLRIIYERNKNDDGCRTFINNQLKKILRPGDTEVLPVLEDFLLMEYVRNRGNDTDDIIINIMHNPNLIPFIREAINKTPNNSDTVMLIEALYLSGAEEEAITKALEILNLPLSQETGLDLFGDMYRNAEVLLFLGKTQRDDLIPVIESYTQQEYFDHYLEVYNQLDSTRSRYSSLVDFQQKAVMALARLGGKSVIPRLRQLYESADIRIRIVSALTLYYNGDITGEKLVRHFVKGTYRDVPEIDMRLGVDMNEKDVFQDVISYLRNDITDALWLEKLTNNIEWRSDRDIADTDFFKDYRSAVLNILVDQLNSTKRSVRGFSLEILQQATGQNFGFQFDRYAGQQEEIIRKWRDYIAQENI